MASLSLSASVGKGSKNNPKDVKLVKALLNVYFRTKKMAVLPITDKSNNDFETHIAIFQKDHLKSVKPDSKVNVNGSTFKNLKKVLDSTFKPIAISDPSYGVVTWQSEGAEGGRYHSRKLHVPSSSSGLTLGRGYDMRRKTQSTLTRDFSSVGIESQYSDKLKKAENLFGSTAEQFVIDNDLLDYQVTPEQQLKLFKISYEAESKEVKRICGKKDVVNLYGKTEWDTLNSYIKDLTIDLKFRGDYTPRARKIIQKSIADNDLATFKKVIKDKKNWSNVPKDRFDRRSNYIDKAKAEVVTPKSATVQAK